MMWWTKILSFAGLHKVKLAVGLLVIGAITGVYWYMNNKIEQLYEHNQELVRANTTAKAKLAQEELNNANLKIAIQNLNAITMTLQDKGTELQSALDNAHEAIDVMANTRYEYVERVDSALSDADCKTTINFMVDQAIGGFK